MGEYLDECLRERAERTKWLSELKPGDEYATRINRYSELWCIENVYRVTKTQIITKTKYGQLIRHRRQDGYAVGDRHGCPRIEPVTQEIRDEVVRNNLIMVLKNCDYAKYNLGHLRRLTVTLRVIDGEIRQPENL